MLTPIGYDLLGMTYDGFQILNSEEQEAFWRKLLLPEEDKSRPWDSYSFRWRRRSGRYLPKAFEYASLKPDTHSDPECKPPK